MRSAVEQQLNLIALGKADYDSVLNHTLEIFKLKFHYFVKNIISMDQLFEAFVLTPGLVWEAAVQVTTDFKHVYLGRF